MIERLCAIAIQMSLVWSRDSLKIPVALSDAQAGYQISYLALLCLGLAHLLEELI